MKIVIDTNVLISAFLTAGTSHDVLYEVLVRQEGIVSNFILKEFKETLLSKKFSFPLRMVEFFVHYLRQYCLIVDEDPGFSFDFPDPGDYKILALCHTVKADFLITGDAELIGLKKIGKTVIIPPAQFRKQSMKYQ